MYLWSGLEIGVGVPVLDPETDVEDHAPGIDTGVARDPENEEVALVAVVEIAAAEAVIEIEIEKTAKVSENRRQ